MNKITHLNGFDFETINEKLVGHWQETSEGAGECCYCGKPVNICYAILWPARESERKNMKENFDKNAGYYFLYCPTCVKLVGKATTLRAISTEQQVET